MGEVEVQWRVTWFPPERSQVTKDCGPGLHGQETARLFAKREAEWHPIIESREVRATPWETVGDADARAMLEHVMRDHAATWPAQPGFRP